MALPATQWRTMFALAALPAALLGLGECARLAQLLQLCLNMQRRLAQLFAAVPEHAAAAAGIAVRRRCPAALPTSADLPSPVPCCAAPQACWSARSHLPGCSSRAGGGKQTRLERSWGERRRQPHSWAQVRRRQGDG